MAVVRRRRCGRPRGAGHGPVVVPNRCEAATSSSRGSRTEKRRCSGTAAVVDESVGGGRVVLMPSDPNARGHSEGMSRVLWNAVLGPDPAPRSAARARAPGRAAAERIARDAVVSRPHWEGALRLTVPDDDRSTVAAMLRRYGARFIVRRAAGGARFTMENPGSTPTRSIPGRSGSRSSCGGAGSTCSRSACPDRSVRFGPSVSCGGERPPLHRSVPARLPPCSRWIGPRSGSCGRPGRTSPSTARCAVTATSSTRARHPDLVVGDHAAAAPADGGRRRDPVQRHHGAARGRGRPGPDRARAWVRWWTTRSARSPTSRGCGRSSRRRTSRTCSRRSGCCVRSSRCR